MSPGSGSALLSGGTGDAGAVRRSENPLVPLIEEGDEEEEVVEATVAELVEE